MSADDAERLDAREARRRELARMPKPALLDMMAGRAREGGARYLVGGPGLWSKDELIDGILGLEFAPVHPRPRGRPPIGPATQVRLSPAMRDRLTAAARPGESMAEAARRLLDAALTAGTPERLTAAARDVLAAYRRFVDTGDPEVVSEALTELAEALTSERAARGARRGGRTGRRLTDTTGSDAR